MKNLIFILCIGFFNAQVAIGTDNLDPSASLTLSPHLYETDSINHGVLLPRVSLNSENDNVSPINSPVDGTLVFNTKIIPTENITKGLYFWDSEFALWSRGYLYEETPKTTIIKFDGPADGYYLLNNAANGQRTAIGTPDIMGELVFSETAANAGVEFLDTPDRKSFQLTQPGNYLIELSYTFILPALDHFGNPNCDPGRCNPIGNISGANGNPVNYYYDGFLYDLIQWVSTPSGGWELESYPPDIGPMPAGYFVRKEGGAITKFDEPHVVSQIFAVRVPNDGRRRAYIIDVGRMFGSSVRDEVRIIPSNSYIKINKF